MTPLEDLCVCCSPALVAPWEQIDEQSWALNLERKGQTLLAKRGSPTIILTTQVSLSLSYVCLLSLTCISSFFATPHVFMTFCFAAHQKCGGIFSILRYRGVCVHFTALSEKGEKAAARKASLHSALVAAILITELN